MFKFKRLTCRRHRLPKRYRSSSRRFVVLRRPRTRRIVRPEPASIEPATASDVPADLFSAVGIVLDELKLRKKYSSRKPRSSKKKRQKGLQYKLQFWKGVSGKHRERKYTRQTRDSHEHNDEVWTSEDVLAIAIQLVDFSFKEVFSLEQKGSSKIAEIVHWVERRFDDSPFNFELCCRAAGYDPEHLRELFFARLDRVHQSRFPHARVLRNAIIDAEHGDPDAIEWVESDTDTPMSFVDCCGALGFNARKVRSELLLPVVPKDLGIEDDLDDCQFGRSLLYANAS